MGDFAEIMENNDHNNINDYAKLSEEERELYKQFKHKLTMQSARAQIKKLEYNLADITAGLSALKTACSDASNLALGGICVAPSFVKPCAVFLGSASNRKSALVACISYPNGGDTTDIKVKAVKRAIKDGADEVEVTAPIAQIRDGNFSYVKREFKKLRSAAKKRSLRISAECELLTKHELMRLCMLAADCRINSVKAASGAYGSDEMQVIADVRSAVKDKCTIKAEGISNVAQLSAAVDMGAGVVGCKNAPAMARYILATAENDAM